MNISIELQSGICNQLIPLISIIRLCDKFNYNLNIRFNKIKSYSHSNNSKSYNITDLLKIDFKYNIFDTIPDSYKKISCDWEGNKSIISSNQPNIFYYNVCHPFYCNDDKNINNYPTKNIKKCTYLNELTKYRNLIVPNELIKEKIDNTMKNINNLKCKILGLHIRSLDGGFIEMYKEKRLFDFIEEFIKNNEDWKIYISTDSINIENKIIEKYNNHIIKLDIPFGNNYEDKFSDNNFGLMNALHEIFILSNCTKLVGSASSSFSFLSFILSNNDILEFWNEQKL